jgi:hypothetical protein
MTDSSKTLRIKTNCRHVNIMLNVEILIVIPSIVMISVIILNDGREQGVGWGQAGRATMEG